VVVVEIYTDEETQIRGGGGGGGGNSVSYTVEVAHNSVECIHLLISKKISNERSMETSSSSGSRSSRRSRSSNSSGSSSGKSSSGPKKPCVLLPPSPHLTIR